MIYHKNKFILFKIKIEKDLEINQLEREIEGLRKQLRENRTKMQTAFGTDYDQSQVILNLRRVFVNEIFLGNLRKCLSFTVAAVETLRGSQNTARQK